MYVLCENGRTLAERTCVLGRARMRGDPVQARGQLKGLVTSLLTLIAPGRVPVIQRLVSSGQHTYDFWIRASHT